ASANLAVKTLVSSQRNKTMKIRTTVLAACVVVLAPACKSAEARDARELTAQLEECRQQSEQCSQRVGKAMAALLLCENSEKATGQATGQAGGTATAETGKPRTSFGDGEWEVGTDIEPGKYKAGQPDDRHCYWAKLRDDEEIIANGSS